MGKEKKDDVIKKLEEIEKNFGDRLEELEKKIDEVRTNVNISHFQEDTLKDMGFSHWVRESLQPRMSVSIVGALEETIRPTVSALVENPSGLKAEEVSRITGRRRNTESGILNKLARIGTVQKTKQGRAVFFKITEEGKTRIYGNR